MKLTEEQQLIVDTVISNKSNNIIAVNAVAGSGKTKTCQSLIEAYKPTNGIYSGFNKAIVKDGVKKFGNLIEVKTIHALAYKYVKPNKPPQDFTYENIKENISYEDKLNIIDSMDDYFRSSFIYLDDYLNDKNLKENLKVLINSYADKMYNGVVNPTFSFLLKAFHLMLHNNEIEVNLDLFILDECQDLIPVTLEIFKLIQAKNKVILGDKYQNIYSFMNTVNAFTELSNLHELRLTKSFRCNYEVAHIVEGYGRQYLEDSFRFKGNEKLIDRYESKAFISRTNAALVDRMHQLIRDGFSFTLTRSIHEIFALPIALLFAGLGKEVSDRRYKYIEKEYKIYINSDKLRKIYNNFYSYLINITQDENIESTVGVLKNFSNKRINLFDLKKKIIETKSNPNIILTTAHAFKGLEADEVYIEQDLNRIVRKVIKEYNKIDYLIQYRDNPRKYMKKEDVEDLNTYYVALSRARSKLYNGNYI